MLLSTLVGDRPVRCVDDAGGYHELSVYQKTKNIIKTLKTSVTPSHNATKQVDMQLSSSAADVTDVSSRELSCKSGSSGVEGLLCAGHLAGPSRGRLGRQEACPEAVFGARRPVLSARRGTQGRERQDDRPEAVFGAREAVLGARRPV